MKNDLKNEIYNIVKSNVQYVDNSAESKVVVYATVADKILQAVYEDILENSCSDSILPEVNLALNNWGDDLGLKTRLKDFG